MVFESMSEIVNPIPKNETPQIFQIYYHILRTGRRLLAAYCLEYLKKTGDNEIKASITDEMLQILRLEDYEKEKINLDNFDPKHNYDGITYLHLACVNQNAFPLVKELLKRGFTLNSKDKLGATPIFYAAVNPDPTTLKYILSLPSNYLRVYDKKNNTPLIMAIIAQRQETIHYMLQLVPSAVKDKSILRLTPLSVACRNGAINTIRTMMSYKGSSPNQPGGWEKMTPL
jgi:ankyrin repeat protein